jgi:hypothetical protein
LKSCEITIFWQDTQRSIKINTTSLLAFLDGFEGEKKRKRYSYNIDDVSFKLFDNMPEKSGPFLIGVGAKKIESRPQFYLTPHPFWEQ